ncbi:phosphonate ABC transporter substrate-binding protein [Rhodobacterales bacterium 52_120_T64]|nr:phosphonate ABC transporter substrate-binding protein [Rhodobacterales bacterium 52_120_T64]
MKLTAILAATTAIFAVATPILAGSNDAPITEFRIGLLGGENEADRLANNECLIERYETLLGVPVKLFPAADYAGVIEGLLGGTLDYAELGSSGYAAVYLEDPNAVEPFATTVQLDGATGYHSVMVARADSGIATLDDMADKSLGFADPNSTSGYLIPSVSLPQQGYVIEDFFGSTTFSGGHEQNILAVLNGDVDGGVTWTSGVGEWEEGFSAGNLRKMVDKGLLDMNDLQLLWTSPIIPNGPLVLRTSLPQETKDLMIASVMAMPKDDPECFYNAQGGEYAGLIEVDEAFYETIIAARKAKIENSN